MKITFEKQEWQLLGQLAIETTQGEFRCSVLPAILLWEFYLENIQYFTQPQTRKRKIRNSTAIGIYQYLQAEHIRNDAYWDATLYALKDKIYQKIHAIKTTDSPLILNASLN